MTTQYLTTEEANLRAQIRLFEKLFVQIACYLRINGKIENHSFAQNEIERMIRCCIKEHMADTEFVQEVAQTCKARLFAVLTTAEAIEKGA